MPYFKQYSARLLDTNEQVVFAVEGRVLPSLSDFIFIIAFAPALYLAPLLMLHHLFRPISYVITTERILSIEPGNAPETIKLTEITRMKGSKKSLLIYGVKKRLWLSRLPDAWHFETIIRKVTEKIELAKKQSS